MYQNEVELECKGGGEQPTMDRHRDVSSRSGGYQAFEKRVRCSKPNILFSEIRGGLVKDTVNMGTLN